MAQKLYKLSTVESTDSIPLEPDEILSFSISGSGTVNAQVKLTDDDDAVWKNIQTCADGVVYATEAGARSFRFNQTAASGETVCEVTTAKL